MDTGTIILGIILFAIATMVIYSWGLMRQKKKPADLMNLLFSKGMAKVKKELKKRGSVTAGDVEQICANLEAKIPFSKDRAVVKNKKDFAQKLLEYMLKTGQIEQEGNRYKSCHK